MIGHSGPIQSMAVSDNGHILFTGGQDHTVRMWKICSGEAIKVMKQHGDGVVQMLVGVTGAVPLLCFSQ
jgi:WD40 repeat protein